MWKLALSALLATGIIGRAVTTESLAVFTDSKSNSANTFTTGLVQITDIPSSAVVTFANMVPGDSITAPLDIANSGSLAYRYAMTTVTTNPDGKALADELQLTVRVKTAQACSMEDGAVLYGPAALSGGLFGSPAQGAQANDRTLAPAVSETLCFKVALPLTTGNAFQSATTTATFTFNAEQTANNP